MFKLKLFNFFCQKNKVQLLIWQLLLTIKVPRDRKFKIIQFCGTTGSRDRCQEESILVLDMTREVTCQCQGSPASITALGARHGGLSSNFGWLCFPQDTFTIFRVSLSCQLRYQVQCFHLQFRRKHMPDQLSLPFLGSSVSARCYLPPRSFVNKTLYVVSFSGLTASKCIQRSRTEMGFPMSMKQLGVLRFELIFVQNSLHHKHFLKS